MLHDLAFGKEKNSAQSDFFVAVSGTFFPVRMTSTHLNKLCRLTDSLVIVRNS